VAGRIAAAATILIVDDDDGVTQTFARILRCEGFTVRTAATAAIALRDAESVRPDAILLDLRMPRVDGLGFLRRLRQRHGARDIPVAIITGDYFMNDDLEAELRSLGADVRYKPLWLDDLVGLARHLVKTP
jgi:CheY-like chemotaxis protein